MLILKYLILSMKIPKNNIYKFNILVIIYFILTFNLNNKIEKTDKFKLIYCLG